MVLQVQAPEPIMSYIETVHTLGPWENMNNPTAGEPPSINSQ